MSERGVDPQQNVDVILACLDADPETHRFEQEAEWLEVCGYPERVAWRWAEDTIAPRWFTHLLDSMAFDHRIMANLGVEWP